MGRLRTTNKDLPRGLQLKDGRYYHVTTVAPRKWTPLGRDRAKALLAWARLEGEQPDVSVTTFAAVALRYEREVIPTTTFSLGEAVRPWRTEDNATAVPRDC